MLTITMVTVAGILTICIHSVEMVEATGSCDPYCVVTVDGREVCLLVTITTMQLCECGYRYWSQITNQIAVLLTGTSW